MANQLHMICSAFVTTCSADFPGLSAAQLRALHQARVALFHQPDWVRQKALCLLEAMKPIAIEQLARTMERVLAIAQGVAPIEPSIDPQSTRHDM